MKRHNGISTAFRVMFLSLIFAGVALGQDLKSPNLREKIIGVEDTSAIDSLSIIPGSVIIECYPDGALVPPAWVVIDEINARLAWVENPGCDSIRITYRVFPLKFNEKTYHKLEKDFYHDAFLINTNPFVPGKAASSVFDFGNLQYDGSFARGISFGTSQSLVLTSEFNLQLSGMLSDDIEVKAVITDNNIPVQPEGTTQQLQEFDKVYIQLGKDDHRLIAGDYEIVKNQTGFFNYYRKLQGLHFDTRIETDKGHVIKGGTSLALSRGKYARNTIAVREGDQGPYRLQGNDGEAFIIVIAGSERVFIDGEMMVRGDENDYVIDYNLGEITFTPNRLITKDKRVVVEFEYVENSYLRTLLQAEVAVERGKWNTWAGVLTTQDNKNQPVQLELDARQREKLRNIGDSIHRALVPAIDTVAFNKSRILYAMIDTVVDSIHYDSVFIYSTDPEKARYSLSFTRVGEGKGNYVLATNSANGRVYQWVAPLNGVPQGQYEPVLLIITPKRHTVMSAGASYAFNKNHVLSSEIALSGYDPNTFSRAGNSDNEGIASRLEYKTRLVDKPDDHAGPVLDFFMDYEFVQKRFKPLERIRTVEFQRDWNLTGRNYQGDEHLVTGGFNMGFGQKALFNYAFSSYVIGNASIYKGFRHQMNGGYKSQGFKLNGGGSWLTSRSNKEETSFIRPGISVSQAIKKLRGWVIGTDAMMERSARNFTRSDSLLSSSFLFYDYRVYVKSPDTSKNNIIAEFSQRYDYSPAGKDFIRATTGTTASFKGDLLTIRNQQFYWRMVFRQLDDHLAGGQSRNYLGRVSYSGALFKGLLRLSTLYELGSGKEQKREYTYQRVTNGQGIYQWIDYNDNGIEEIDEFEPATFSDSALYIKVLLPTNEYLPVNIITFNQSLSVLPATRIQDNSFFTGILRRFSFTTTIQLNRKVFRQGNAFPFNPFKVDVDDDALLSLGALFRQGVYFNRYSPVWAAEYIFQDNRNKSLLTSGFETRQFTEHALRLRWNLFPFLSLDQSYTFRNKLNSADLFTDRNYDIQFHIIETSLSYLLRNSFRATVQYIFTRGDNTAGMHESMVMHKPAFQLRYNVAGKSALTGQVSYARVQFDGAQNTPTSFAMLEGLKNGGNIIWSASYDKTIAGNIQLTFRYDGRKTGTNEVVHTGTTQLRAIF